MLVVNHVSGLTRYDDSQNFKNCFFFPTGVIRIEHLPPNTSDSTTKHAKIFNTTIEKFKK